jgi:hypothetical protein
MSRTLRIARLMLAVVPLFAVATSSLTHAQCSYPFMASGSAVHYTNSTVLYPTIVQNTNYWSAVAVRPDAGSDWDLSLNSTATAFPTCVTGTLASSTYGAGNVDVVIGDFNHNALGTYYARPYLFAGTGGATVEWDDGSDQLGVNAPWISRSTGPNDVLECWDVFLEQSKVYYFYLANTGNASLRFLFFQSPGATYWGGRSTALYETPPISNGSLSVQFTANANDWYGVVVINENGEVADYKVEVTTCLPPTALASATPVTAIAPERHYSFVQSSNYFTAVGVRPNNPAEDWAIRAYAGPYDVNNGSCLQNELAGSLSESGKAKYIVGDFNAGANSAGTYYAWAFPFIGGIGTAEVEWDDGVDQIVIDAPPIVGSTDSTDVVTCWDVPLEAGHAYNVFFEHDGTANLKVGVFENPGGIYWVPRSSASAEHASSFYYNAPTTDWYGVVVVNDNGQGGNYQLAFTSAGVGVDETPPLVTRLEGMAPNPMVSGSFIRYALRERGDVRFDVLDAAGRRVSRIVDGARAAGRWNTTWSGVSEDGTRLGAGVYFVRMIVDNRVVEGSKVVLLQ